MTYDKSSNEDAEQAGLIIPVPPKRFGQFIAGLLSTPRRVSRTREMIFDLDLDAIRDFYHLVSFRMQDQHIAEQISFRCVFYYDDGRSVEQRSIEEVERYNEVGDRTCVGVSMIWIYLVRLPGSSEPQKHTIDLSFLPGEASRLSSSARKFSSKLQRRYWYPTCDYVVEHSSVTWGNDVANMLDQRLDQLEVRDRFSAFFRSPYTGILATAVLALIFFVASAILVINTFVPRISNSFEEAVVFLSDPRWFIVDTLLTVILMLQGALVGLGTLGALRWLSQPRPATITLSSRAKDETRKMLRKFERRWIKVAASAAITISLGVLSSIIASGLWEQYLAPQFTGTD